MPGGAVSKIVFSIAETANRRATGTLSDRWRKTRVRRSTLLLALLVIVPLVAILAGCAKSQPQAAAAAPAVAPPPPEVLVDLPVSEDIVDHEDFTGRTVASKTIELRARVTGYLDKINFIDTEGRDVEKGDILFEIDPRSFEAEYARALATFQQAESHTKRVERDYDRARQTVASKTISQEAFDEVISSRNQSKSQLAIAKANLDLARLNLSYTKVRAPISGHVSRTQLDQGNLVQADDTVLTTIVAKDPMYAYFELDERTLLKIRRYTHEGKINTQNERHLPIKMALADEEGYPHDGLVTFFDNQLDPSTGTLQARGVFRNETGMLSPGMFVRIRLPVGKPYKALVVSEQSLGTDQGQKFVYVVDQENKAQYRRVDVGKLQNGRRVILDGLADGERVVVSGLQRVRPGAPVSPKLVATAGSTEAATPAVAEAGAEKAQNK